MFCFVSFLPCCTAKLQFQGRQWIDSVRPCLMREIGRSNLYSSPTGGDSDCDNLRILAFNSHPSCYVRHGFCSIVISLSNLNGLFFALQFGRDFVGPYWREAWAQVYFTVSVITIHKELRYTPTQKLYIYIYQV